MASVPESEGVAAALPSLRDAWTMIPCGEVWNVAKIATTSAPRARAVTQLVGADGAEVGAAGGDHLHDGHAGAAAQDLDVEPLPQVRARPRAPHRTRRTRARAPS